MKNRTFLLIAFIFVNTLTVKAQIIYSSTNGKYNQAHTMQLDGQNMGIKPISCGLQHIEKKHRKTGEITKYDRIVLMLIDQNDATYIIYVNFRNQPTAAGKFSAGEEEREKPIPASLDNFSMDNYVYVRPHFSIEYYIKDTDKKLSFFESVYGVKINGGTLEITRFDLENHRISFKIDATLENKNKKTIDLKGLIINDLPMAEMTADGIGMPKKVIYQERF